MTLLAPFRFVAGLALPPRCPGCGAVTIEDHHFCVTCWSALRFLGPPWCAGCNLPFAYDRGEGALCAECHRTPPRHAGVRAAVAYGDVSRTVALKLKYGGRTAYAETVARQMVRLMPAQADLLVPVPLHRWRIWSRGYNQAALIATALARASGTAADLAILQRIRATPSMRGLGPREREKMVARAFQVDPKRKSGLRGKAVILVDDVHTSGATSDSCSRILLRAGAASVTILCWARVLDPTQSD
ncbi:ComF family protein [Sphingomonas sp.]|uniref:ComF family protein n=1 Tax=Sphingomonas sp. TaxID=28214 RepID=UPI003D6CD4FA